MTPLRARLALALTALALSVPLGGCAAGGPGATDGASDGVVEPTPAGKVRAPDATGTIEAVHFSDGPVSITFEPDAGFEYFAGTTFDVPPGAFPHGEDGVTLAASDLGVGDRINVWVGACAESFPVQCEVERVELAP
jgi:hypothetical protein